MRSLLRCVTLLTLAGVGVACDQVTAPPGPGSLTLPSGPSAAISDAENGGRAGFYFLPPLVPDPSPFPSTFDPTRQPTASVCPLNSGGTACQGAAIMTFPFGGGGATAITVNLAGQSYNATWSKANLSAGRYRLEVFEIVPGFGQQVLGYLDIQVVANSKGLKNIDAGFVGLVRNSPLSIKFRIENGAVGVVTVAPPSATILVGGTQAFTATVYDLDGNVMASPPTVAWSSSAPSVAAVSASGLATGVSGGTAFIRATSGGVTGQSELTVIAEAAPSVTTTVPAANATNVATGSNVSITFDEPVDVTGDWFEIACGTSGTRKPSVAGSVVVSGGPTTFSLDPATEFVPGENCTVTVFAAQVTDEDANDPPGLDNMAADYVFSFSTADNAPDVSSTIPIHLADNVAKNSNIVVNFSESVNVSASSFTLACPVGTAQAFQLTPASPAASFTLNPDSDLPANTLCRLTVVAAEVTDADLVDPPGFDNMPLDRVVEFTTQPDAADPAAVADAYTTNAGVTLNVAAPGVLDNDNLGFPVATLTHFGGGSLGGISTVTSNVAGATVNFGTGGSLKVNADGSFDFTPATGFSGPFTFEYRISNGVTSDATVTITVDAPPTVASTTPTNGATNQATNTDITVTFSEPVTATGAWFSLSCATSGSHAVAVSGGPTTYTLNPTTDFTPGELCTATVVAAQIADQDGTPQNMAADHVFSFTVDEAPSVIATSPADNSEIAAATSNILITFSEPVALGASWFSLVCGTDTRGPSDASVTAGPGANQHTIDLTANLPGGASCTMTIVAAQITDTDAGDPPDNMAANHVFTFAVPITAVDDPNYTATGNIAIAVAAAGVLANDIPATGLTVSEVQGSGANVGVFANTSAVGLGGVTGRVKLNANGSFDYDPPPGYTGTDQFTYKVTNGSTTSNVATVTVTVSAVSGALMWFVCDACTSNNRGTLLDPFTSVAAFSAVNTGGAPAPQPNHLVYIRSGTYEGAGDNLTLRAGQKAYGQAVAASSVFTPNAASVSAFAGLTASGTRSVIAPASGTAVTVSTDNTLQGFDVAATGTAAGIASGASFSTLNVSDMALSAAGRALSLTDGTLTATFTSVTSSGGVNNVLLAAVAASGTVTLGTGALSGATGEAFKILGASSGMFAYAGSIAGGGAQAVSIDGGTASLSLSGNVSQANNAPLLSVSGGHSGGTLTMTGQVSATNGNGLQFNNADGTYNLNGAAASSSLNGGDAGIDIGNGSSGTFTFGSNLSITNPSGTAFFVGASAPTVTMNGAINQNAGKRGVFLENNTGGTVTFTGALTLSTTTANAFDATTAGPGALGTVVVQTATSNALTTTTGTALRINNVNIGAGGLVFRSIASNGAVNGILLNNTGSAGGLTVAGNGGVCTVATPTCTGGSIQASTGPGINLTSTAAVSLTLMRVNTGSDDGIRGSNVTGFTLASSLVSGNGNALTENGLDFSGLFGAASITGSVITGSFNYNAAIRNTSGTLTSLTVSNTTFSNNVSTSDGDGLLVDASGTANMSVNVSNSTFTAHHSDHFQAAAANSAVLNAVFTSNTLSGGHAAPLGQGITINAATGAPGFSGSVTYDINGNTINGAISNAIMANLGTSAAGAVFRGQIRNNAIGATGVPLSCSTQANGVNVEAHGNGTHTTSVTGNTIRRCFDRGINMLANDGNGVLNATVTNNTVTEMADANGIAGTPREAFILQAGSTSTNVFGAIDSHAVCLNLTSAVSGSLVGGAFKNGDIRVRRRFRSSIRLPGYAGGSFDTAAVIAFLQGNNAGTTATATTDADDAAVATDGYFGGAACTLP